MSRQEGDNSDNVERVLRRGVVVGVPLLAAGSSAVEFFHSAYERNGSEMALNGGIALGALAIALIGEVSIRKYESRQEEKKLKEERRRLRDQARRRGSYDDYM